MRLVTHAGGYLRDSGLVAERFRRIRRRLPGPSCWYHDSYTGTSMDRPGFRKLVKDMETGQVNTLVV